MDDTFHVYCSFQTTEEDRMQTLNIIIDPVSLEVRVVD